MWNQERSEVIFTIYHFSEKFKFVVTFSLFFFNKKCLLTCIAGEQITRLTNVVSFFFLQLFEHKE